jgi:hypothetical protein
MRICALVDFYASVCVYVCARECAFASVLVCMRARVRLRAWAHACMYRGVYVCTCALASAKVCPRSRRSRIELRV